jgi:hypothetical protein
LGLAQFGLVFFFNQTVNIPIDYCYHFIF